MNGVRWEIWELQTGNLMGDEFETEDQALAVLRTYFEKHGYAVAANMALLQFNDDSSVTWVMNDALVDLVQAAHG